jgi:hypothetical protein
VFTKLYHLKVELLITFLSVSEANYACPCAHKEAVRGVELLCLFLPCVQVTGWYCTEDIGGYLRSWYWVTDDIILNTFWGCLCSWFWVTDWHYTEAIWGFSLLLILCDWLTRKLKRFGVYIHSWFWVTDDMILKTFGGCLCSCLQMTDWHAE